MTMKAYPGAPAAKAFVDTKLQACLDRLDDIDHHLSEGVARERPRLLDQRQATAEEWRHYQVVSDLLAEYLTIHKF